MFDGIHIRMVRTLQELELHAEGWNTLCQSEALVSFYRVLTNRLADLSWLEWGFWEIEGKRIAAILAILVNRSKG